MFRDALLHRHSARHGPLFSQHCCGCPWRRVRTREMPVWNHHLSETISLFYFCHTVWKRLDTCRLNKPNKKPARFQRGNSAVGRTRFSARISLNFSRCFFSWSHISWRQAKWHHRVSRVLHTRGFLRFAAMNYLSRLHDITQWWKHWITSFNEDLSSSLGRI